jgi:drug/metabolite transporter (DMT)-like permease
VNRKNSVLGAALILLGIAVFLKNFRVMPGSSITIIAGLFFLYLFYIKKQQAFLVLGLVAILAGIISILRDLNIFDLKITGEAILILIGIVFIALYYSKKNIGFLIPGVILISLGLYISLINYYNTTKLWPCFFILLGMAFYSIYFIALYGKENWPLVIGTILCLLGLTLLAFSYGILNRRLWRYYNYLWPLALVFVGVILILGKFKGRKG